jgi:UDP-N-acetyl-2-amino-2-deoxyglucuronate dehydrogenase
MTDTRVGIVGLGAQGSVYAELISGDRVPNMDLGAICDGNLATRQLIESKYSARVFYYDYLTMLKSGSVDAVVICVPSYLHPQMGIAALQHGIHVLLVKSESRWGPPARRNAGEICGQHSLTALH